MDVEELNVHGATAKIDYWLTIWNIYPRIEIEINTCPIKAVKVECTILRIQIFCEIYVTQKRICPLISKKINISDAASITSKVNSHGTRCVEIELRLVIHLGDATLIFERAPYIHPAACHINDVSCSNR